MDPVRGVSAPLFVLLMLAALGAASLVRAEHALPDKVASHFNGKGQADGWMSRESYVQSMGLIGFVMPVFLLGIGFAMKIMPSDLINLPRRDFWLSPARRHETVHYLARQFAWMACLAEALLISLNWLMIEANRQSPPQLSNLVWVLCVAYLAGVVAWIAFLIGHFYRVTVERSA
jgi:hypothetical protein